MRAVLLYVCSFIRLFVHLFVSWSPYIANPLLTLPYPSPLAPADRPKGVVHSHGSLAAQVHSLSKAWRLSERDRILHCLPLHHIHGVVNALLLPLYVGGSVAALPHFSVRGVFDALCNHRSTVFMGVPTMYSYLIKHVAKLDSKVERMVAIEAIRSQALWICGSSALPLPLAQQWKALSGSYPLERYGMTETGMILGTCCCTLCTSSLVVLACRWKR